MTKVNDYSYVGMTTELAAAIERYRVNEGLPDERAAVDGIIELGLAVLTVIHKRNTSKEEALTRLWAAAQDQKD